MKRAFSAIVIIATMFAAGVAWAQDSFWVQVEANATLREAEDSVRRYSDRVADVNGFRLGASGWYATAIGPYTEASATAKLLELRAEGILPSDAYVSDSAPYSLQFWPVGANALAATPVELAAPAEPEVVVVEEPVVEEPQADAAPEVVAQADPAPATDAAPETEAAAAPEVAPEPAAEPAPVEVAPVVVAEPEPEPEETRQQALESERALDSDQRKELQIAMQWEGYYKSLIDGDFGPGTRAAMSAWQDAKGYEVTGILTTRQRAELLGDYNAVLSSMGLADTVDMQAGISVTLPKAMVSFSRYEAPFVHYEGDQGVRVVLISQSGDKATLYGLYDILQTLEVMPAEGDRNRRDSDFTITGADDKIISYTYAKLADGAVKGFMLIWPQGDKVTDPDTGAMAFEVDRRRGLVLDAMKSSFASTGPEVLADNAGLDEATQSIDLISGLEIRRAERARSGFFVSANGAVLTTIEAVDSCDRVTLNESYDADIVATDAALGLALLQPKQALAPLAVAELLTYNPRLNSELAVAGYSYGGRLSSPTLTFGTLAEVRGLDGEDTISRLTIKAQDGDTGGPVLDQGGAVIGMLMAPPAANARQLPADVALTAKSTALAAFLTANGIAPTPTDLQGAMTPYDLSALAANMTVLVSCWK